MTQYLCAAFLLFFIFLAASIAPNVALMAVSVHKAAVAVEGSIRP